MTADAANLKHQELELMHLSSVHFYLWIVHFQLPKNLHFYSLTTD